MTDKHAPAAGLVRGLGLAASTSVVVGTVIGTGIFLKTRVMMCNVETPWLVLAAWLAAGVLSLAGALTYAELAAMMPRAGGEYVFIREAYGAARPPSCMAGRSSPSSYTRIAGSQGRQLRDLPQQPVGGALDRTFFTAHLAGYDIPAGRPLQVIALGVIILATLVNCLAVTVGGGISVVLTGLKILAVVAIGGAAFLLAQGHWAHFAMSGAGGACEGVEPTARGGLQASVRRCSVRSGPTTAGRT